MKKYCYTKSISKIWKNYCGVYAIYISSHVYIGSTKNMYDRMQTHRKCLKKGCKENYKLINAFNKYGISETYWQILEQCSEDQLLSKEKYWIEKLDPDLNIIKDPTVVPKYYPVNDLNSNSKIVYQYDLDGNFLQEYPSCREAARQLNVEGTIISQCAGNTHPNVHSAYGYQWSYIKYSKMSQYVNNSSKAKIIPIYIFDVLTGEELFFNSIADGCRYLFPSDNFDSMCASISGSCRKLGFFKQHYLARFSNDIYYLPKRNTYIYNKDLNVIYSDAKEASEKLNLSKWKVQKLCKDESYSSLQYMGLCAQVKLRESGKLFQ